MSTSKMRYEKMDPITHIHRRTDMYIGDPRVAVHPPEWLWDSETQQMKLHQEPRYSDGLVRILVEPLSNMIDNLWRSREAGVKCSKLAIRVKERGIEFWNDGLGIPVCRASETAGGEGEDGNGNGNGNLYVPEMIFGHLLTSSNYDDQEDRFTSGRNGIGVKLSNVFSTLLEIEVGDAERGLVYTQTWRRHMRDMCDPVIRKKSTMKHSYTRIYFEPDVACFGIGGGGGDPSPWDETIKGWIHKIAHDTAALTALPFHLTWLEEETRVIKLKSLKEYATKCFPFTDGADASITECTVELDKNQKVEVVIAYASGDTMSSHDYRELGYVNGIYNREGGVHTDAVSGEFFRGVMGRLQKSHKQFPLTVKDLKPGFMIWVHAQLINPAFSSQNKTRLVAPTPKMVIPSRVVESVVKWGAFKKRVEEEIRAKLAVTLKKAENKKRMGATVRIEGLDPANLAGGSRSDECTLILCEGLSAKTYAVVGIEMGFDGKKGRDYFGIYPLRGKLLNCRNASLTAVAQNKEITDLIQAMNLRHGVDYQNPENRKQLHYGRVMILTDSDVDGLHIASLILNAFHVLFPTLCTDPHDHVSTPFLYWMMTPVAKLYYPRTTQTFYNDFEYQAALDAMRTGAPQPMKIKYFKGLGTCSNAEVGETFGQKVVGFEWDTKSTASMCKAFHASQSHDRKSWMEEYSRDKYAVPENNVYPVTTFIDQELIRYSIDDCMRSLPNLLDGLKQSQRKILYAVFKKNLKAKSMKVAQLSGYVAEVSNYHHGEQCLYDTITKMAHHFVGSNNLPYLVRDGQFGCLDPETPVRMLDGSERRAAEVEVGDQLQGDDGTPRRVLRTVSGEDQMYTIRPRGPGLDAEGSKRLSYKVNSEHILTLRGPPRLEWCEEEEAWILRYLDFATGRIEEYKSSMPRDASIEERARVVNSWPTLPRSVSSSLSGIEEWDVWDMRLMDYRRLPHDTQPLFKTFTASLAYSFEVEYEGLGKFAGFTLNKNERFVLGNGIVTHNSRSYLGKDAANARYIFTRMDPLLRPLYPAVDDALLPSTLDDGDLVEPEYYVPILPMILVNGCSAGIGTGWSCSVPCFHPIRLMGKILDFLSSSHGGGAQQSDTDTDEAWTPWYRHFRGTIRRVDKKRAYLTEGVLKRPGEYTLPEAAAAASKKKAAAMTARSWCVEEIPVKESINRYKEFLEKLQEDKQIRGLSNYSSADKPFFMFEPVAPFEPNIASMKLSSEVSVSNLVLWTDDHRLHKYGDIPEIFYTFCEKRLALYDKRRAHLLRLWKQQLKRMEAVYRFLREVSDNTLTVFRVPEEEIVQALETREYPRLDEPPSYEYLLSIRIRQFSQQHWEAHEKKIAGQKKRIRTLQDTTPQDLWRGDLAVFLKEYTRIYPEEQEAIGPLQSILDASAVPEMLMMTTTTEEEEEEETRVRD